MSLDFFKQKNDTIIPLVLLGVALLMLLYNTMADPSKRVSPMNRGVRGILSYPQAMVTRFAEGVGNTWNKYFYLRGVEEENQRLREELDTLYYEAQQMKEKLVRVRMNLPDPVWRGATRLPAKIIALSQRPEILEITINRGSKDGVKYNMPIITGMGVVGKVIGGGSGNSVPARTSLVLLLIDPRCRVDALVYRMIEDNMPDPMCPWNPSNWAQTRVRGVVQGNRDRLILKFVNRGEELKLGDMVVSSGLGGVFPKGLALGTVVNVEPSEDGLSMNIEVNPAVNFDRIEEVMVMIKEGDPLR